MTDTTTVIVQPPAEQDLTRRARWCVAAGLVGVAQGAALLAWPHQVDDSRFSFPLTARWDVVAQATFFLQHLPLVIAVAGIAALPAVRRETAAHRALAVATAGLGLLALMELVAMSAATTANDSSLGTVVSSLYTLPVVMVGVGMLVAAVVLLRSHTLGRRVSWTLLGVGGFVFVGLVPALATDSFVAGRLAIMAWMALFALLGVVMQRPAR